jgi:hypothetical protein
MVADPRYTASTQTPQKTHLPLLRVSVAAIMWRLVSHSLATGVFAASFPSNGCLCWLQDPGFQQTCHSINSLGEVIEINRHLKLNTGLNDNSCQSGPISPLRGQFYVVFCAKKATIIWWKIFRYFENTWCCGRQLCHNVAHLLRTFFVM